MDRDEILKRMLYREFLVEKELYQDAGLDQLPQRLGALIGRPQDQAIRAALEGPLVEAAEDFERLRQLLQIRDMVLLSHTPANIAAELKEPATTYEDCVRRALCYAVAERPAHCFAALRAAAAKNDDWARHHYLYGLLHALAGDDERAGWELELAIEREPYDDGRARINRLLDLLDVEKR